MRLRSTVVIVCAAACRLEPNPAFDEPVDDGTSNADESTSAANGTSTDTTDGSSSEASSSSSGEVPEGCYDGIVVAGELCFEYRAVTLGRDAWAVATGDFDDDDHPDALVGGYASAEIFYGDGSGSFWGVRQLYSSGVAGPSTVTGALATDLNGDGRSDVVLSYGDGNAIDVFLSYGQEGSFADPHGYVVGSGPQRVVAADVDGDGLLDVVTATKFDNQVVVLFGTGDGELAAGLPIDVGTMPQSVAVADLTGDGLGDVVVAPTAEAGINVLVNQDEHMFAVGRPIPIGTNPVTVVLSDLDVDGYPDLFVSTGTQENFVLYGVEVGLFTDEGLWWNWTGRMAFAAAPGDFNADGIRDIAWAEGYMGNGGMTWMLGQGDRFFEAELNPLYSFPMDLAVADFNHDGIDDVVLANINSGFGLGLLLSVP